MEQFLAQIYRYINSPLYEEFEDTKGVIRIRISKKTRQHNGQKKKYKQRSTKHTYKTKDQVTRTPLKTGGELLCSGRVSSSCSTSDTRRVNLVTNPMISHDKPHPIIAKEVLFFLKCQTIYRRDRCAYSESDIFCQGKIKQPFKE